MDNIIEPSPKAARIFFFWTGIIATVAYRIIIFLNIYSSLWVDIAWYIGTAGFVLYFWHRYQVAKKRAELVKKYNLVEAVEISQIEKNRKQALHYLVETSLTSKSRWNSGLIFLLSLIALILGAVLDIYSILNL
ncbi:MAG: hypothetical protein A2365_03445 [Candidatus Nealsonbacteria bacterium RIFOXYB1_FULL_40_15]|uniref:Uncharacterized protein n=2 Tax=Candidatus Nealsoniibacteriota TaxID=1817911 RepID=A0A1G2ERG0_9BACT|nr:MAG: hypothetical protein A2365_03445 [Candidatus Nealsonbacteria bacterium RIFOXYB1_FULL_40_15]OGZ28359.1 MAG: hypothetical protein A2427_01125 [Candidatus Nealsonbacteria bacterium RIFOXYC1_FULL_40_7]OGZ29484.1 MAG: hypothetical protein A2562_02220 [Candidatus Nealsonbacteria bacterium RIFOXYD1_FULL_39_11]